MTRVLITDYTFPDLQIEESVLQDPQIEVTGCQYKTVDDLKPMVANADAVITQFAPVDRDVIAAMQNARVIVRYGIGVDNVDLEAATEKNIPVCNIPDYCIDEVADHTLAFILGLTRQVTPNALSIRKGEWGLATPLDQMRTLRDQTVGILGFGRIGQEVSNRLRPFKSSLLVYDPVVSADAILAAGATPVTLDELLAQADILTLHCPSTAATQGIINASTIAQMKPGSLIINLARGDLIDSSSLISALESGHLAGAALDVCDVEPMPQESALRSMPNVIAAAHIASASPKAVQKLRSTAAQIALSALLGNPLSNIVNGVKG